MRNVIVQLFVWDGPERVRDIQAIDMPRDRKRLADSLSAEGFDEPGNPDCSCFAELHVVPRVDSKPDFDNQVVHRIVPGGLPARCRKRRACVKVDDKDVDVQDFIWDLYGL